MLHTCHTFVEYWLLLHQLVMMPSIMVAMHTAPHWKHECINPKAKKERKTTLMLPLAWIMVLLHFQVALSLNVFLIRAYCWLKGPPKTTASFQRWTPWTHVDKPTGVYLPQGQAPRFPDGWLKMSGSLGYPHYDWVGCRWWGAPEIKC